MDMRTFYKLIDKATAGIRRRIILMCSRILVTAIDDSQGIQIVNIDALANESITDVERFQEFGFTSHPPVGSEGIAVFIAGDRTNGFVIRTENRTYRVKNLSEGEMAIYSMGGKKVHCGNDKIAIGESEDPSSIDQPLVLGTELQTLLSDILTAISTHTHLGNLGIATGPPLNASTFTTLKASPVDDGEINSNLAFTEKGS
jgi:phage gp45-like